MSELDHDWIQRDLDGGAVWDERAVPLDLVSELRYGHGPAEPAETEDRYDDDFDDDLDDRR